MLRGLLSLYCVGSKLAEYGRGRQPDVLPALQATGKLAGSCKAEVGFSIPSLLFIVQSIPESEVYRCTDVGLRLP